MYALKSIVLQLRLPHVLDECVDLAHRFGAEQGHAYVNAVLDRAAREWRPAETEEVKGH